MSEKIHSESTNNATTTLYAQRSHILQFQTLAGEYLSPVQHSPKVMAKASIAKYTRSYSSCIAAAERSVRTVAFEEVLVLVDDCVLDSAR